MKLNTLKLELIKRILATDDPQLLEEMLEVFSRETVVLKEARTSYHLKEKEAEPLDLSTLSPEFQESIRRGLADAEAGRMYTQEQMEKFFEDWLQED